MKKLYLYGVTIMNLSRYIFLVLFALLMGTYTWAEETVQVADNQEQNANEQVQNESEQEQDLSEQDKKNIIAKRREGWCGSFPGNIIVGAGAHSFTAGVELSFGNNILYCSESERPEDGRPYHFVIWTTQAHYLYVSRKDGAFLQPNLQYIYLRGPRLNLTVGPEVGVWIHNFDFDYGVSARIGTLYNLVNVELGYLFNTNVLYLNFLVSISLGDPY